MSRRGAGVVFIGFATLLFSTRFVCAAIWGSGFSSWNAEHFQSLLTYVDQGLTTASLIALVIGGIYILWAEIGDLRGP
jgi:uncharacterized PurR-regulated membrane protein YhhQ (DUF165 family)